MEDKAFKSWKEWIQKSNEAGEFREAFRVSEAMPLIVALEVNNAIRHKSYLAYNKYKEGSD